MTLRVGGDPAEHEQVIVRFLKDYFHGAGRHDAVVGLSGGVDSAVSAALAARALGPDHVEALVLPTKTTPKEDLDDAALVADALGVTARTVPIDAQLDALEQNDAGFSRDGRGNAAARVRMIHLHEAARRRKALVVGTGNKSEALVGYFTKYGDGGVDVQPIGDLYKTQVYALAEHLVLPDRVRTKAPSARLWEGQTDEQELGMTYETLDRMLLGLEIRLPNATIADVLAIDVAEVDRFAAVRAAKQHKRRTPLAPKIGLRTVGNDWRQATYR
jgi:NAD+ synthase